MTERIDHAAEARRYLGLVPASLHADEVIAVAQVHATLALVEQQRIANLIAVAQMEGGPCKDANDWAVEKRDYDGRYVGDEAANVFLRREIREALGLS